MAADHDHERTLTIESDAAAPIALDAAELPPGTSIGRYRIEGAVGRGGMGIVYRAHDPELGRAVAIKLMLNERGRRPDASRRARMVREARAAGSVVHPNVITLYDVGVHDGLVYIAMELLPDNLQSWLEAEPRPWRTVLAKFIAAGRGLRAAHDAGLLHRDFKPSNVLLGSDGRVKVADFGLACVTVEVSTDGCDSDSTPSRGTRLAQAGMWVGTPGFVSPEQFAGDELDARADQFSFCVALYRALYRHAPFDGDVNEVQGAVARDAPRPPPPDTDVPRWVWRVLARGMRYKPRERWPSMEALLRQLAGGRKRAAATWVAAVAGGAAIAVALAPTPESSACTGGPQALAEVWSESQRATFQSRRAQASGSVARAWRRAIGQLDTYAEQWQRTYAEVCAAPAEAEDGEARDAELACLVGQLDDVDALVRASTSGSSISAMEAARAARLLPRPVLCTDPEYAAARMRPPQDAPSRFEARSLLVALAEIAALRQAGHYHEAFGELEPIVVRADALDYAPITARAHLEQGRLELEMALGSDAVESLEVAYFAAVEAGAEQRQVDAAVELIGAYSRHLGDRDAAERWGRLALASVARLGDSPVVGDVQAAIASAHMEAGDLHAAWTWANEALTTRERLLPPEDLDVADSYRRLGVINLFLGRHDESFEHLELALELQRAQLGYDHPEVARTLNALGIFANESGRRGEDLAYYEEALAITERVYGPEHPRTAPMLQNMANALMGSDPVEANRMILRALELRELAYGEDNPNLAGLHRATANSFYGRGQIDQAQHHYERAMELVQASGEDEHAGLLHELATIAWVRGHFDAALEMSRRAIELGTVQESNPVQLARLELAAARLQWDVGADPVEAMELGAKARGVFAETGHDHFLAMVDDWIEDPGPPGARLGPRP